MALRKYVSAVRVVKLYIFLIIAGISLEAHVYASDDIQFNTDVLDVKERKNIDLGQFSQRGYIMPGKYSFTLRVNQNEFPESTVDVYAVDKDEKGSRVCFTPAQVQEFGFKEKYQKVFTLWHQNQCVDIQSLKGVEVRPDLGSGVLTVSVPQAYLDYTSDYWVPSSMWEDGISGLIADYNFNAQSNRDESTDDVDNSVSGDGTFGANMGPWRLRADWQSSYDDNSGEDADGQKSWTWNRVYLFRALRSLGAKLTLGEDYLNSDLFDSFRFTGASVVSDDNMLPPNLRGYAPEVTGLARTNAKVTISQQGRVIYETQVAAGPFEIQDLSDAVTGTLDVRVQEQDGSVQEYKVSTATIPYLARPGSVRYKLFAGRPTDYDHHSEGDMFGSGEFSWGISNGWSLYGGGVGSSDYQSVAMGIGRDLMQLGAMAFDVTRSDATLDGGNRTGMSYRLSYSKRFDETDSQVTFAGYRFSEKDFMSFNDYLDYSSNNDEFQQSKEMYTITFNQQLPIFKMSAYLNYSHQTYWNSPSEDRYSLSLAKYVDIGKWRNINVSLTAYRNKFNDENDDGAYVSVSLPFGDSGTLGYNATVNGSSSSNRLSYYNRLVNGDNYQIAAGETEGDISFSGYYDHPGDISDITGNVSYQQNQYSSLGLSLRGGATATLKGAALHRSDNAGGTRVMVDTGEAADIPVQGYTGIDTRTNSFGKAVITDVSDYGKNNLSIDVNKMPENAESSGSVMQATLTEGAIGYRKFNVLSGQKAMGVIRLRDGSYPPFGASVYNSDSQEAGIVNDEGMTYLSGLHPSEKMQVKWGGRNQCAITLPQDLTGFSQDKMLLLLCQR
ncbi:outer membrane usher protein [Salmonella enterica subsp. enterica serovar Sandiego]|nr:outer membrane usher protein [Salmonella enterica subsp. enterica serovar Sandiego]EIT4520860.1 outer membrane usher protein [Salmonella enterica subsp. enterica serovar Sandiego]